MGDDCWSMFDYWFSSPQGNIRVAHVLGAHGSCTAVLCSFNYSMGVKRNSQCIENSVYIVVESVYSKYLLCTHGSEDSMKLTGLGNWTGRTCMHALSNDTGRTSIHSETFEPTMSPSQPSPKSPRLPHYLSSSLLAFL